MHADGPDVARLRRSRAEFGERDGGFDSPVSLIRAGGDMPGGIPTGVGVDCLRRPTAMVDHQAGWIQNVWSVGSLCSSATESYRTPMSSRS